MTVESEKIANGIGRGMAVDLKDYFERLWTEHEKRHDRDHDSDEEALGKAFEAVDLANKLANVETLRRLGELNHAHEAAREKEKDFIQRENFEAKMSDHQRQINKLIEDLGTVRVEMGVNRGRTLAWSAAIALFFVVLAAARGFL